jgi:hypothetical protein
MEKWFGARQDWITNAGAQQFLLMEALLLLEQQIKSPPMEPSMFSMRVVNQYLLSD